MNNEEFGVLWFTSHDNALFTFKNLNLQVVNILMSCMGEYIFNG